MPNIQNANNGEIYLEQIKCYLLGESLPNIETATYFVESDDTLALYSLKKDDKVIPLSPQFHVSEWQSMDINALTNVITSFFPRNTKVSVNHCPNDKFKIYLYNVPVGNYKAIFGADSIEIDFIQQETF